MAAESTTKVPTWVFWLVPLLVVLVVLVVLIAFMLAPAYLGSYRVGDVYSTSVPTNVAAVSSKKYLEGTPGAFAGSYEQQLYTLPPGTQVRVTRIRDKNSFLTQPRQTPEVLAQILTGPNAGTIVDLTAVSTATGGQYHPTLDPSPTYLTLVTRGR